jgi:hypothetical protein
LEQGPVFLNREQIDTIHHDQVEARGGSYGLRSGAGGLSRGRSLIEGDFNLGIAARCRCVYGCDDAVHVPVNGWPLGVAKDHDGNPASFEILLVSDVLIGGEQDLESGFLGRFQQFAVAQICPSPWLLPG